MEAELSAIRATATDTVGRPRESALTGGPLPRPRDSAAYSALVVALLLAIALVPLWSVDIPPLMDYHNHLARQYILAKLPHSEHLQAFYQADWRAGPYLAMDAIVQGLAKFMPVATAGRHFLSLMFLLVAAAPVALSLALHGRVTVFALLGLLTLHNETLSLGFVHYLFSVGFALCLLALWIRLRTSRVWVRLTVLPVLSSLLFFSHLIGFALYAVAVCAYELGRHVEQFRGRTPHKPLSLDRVQQLNLGSLCLQFLLPLAIFALFGPATTVASQNTHGGLGRKLDLLLGALTYLIPPYLWTLDRILVVVLPMAMLTLVFLRRLAIAKYMAWPLLALLLLFFATPWNLFGGFGADHRMLPAIALLLAGSVTWRAAPHARQVGRATADRPDPDPVRRGWLVLQPGAGRWRTLGFGLVVGLIVVRTAAITVEWRQADRVYAEYLRAFELLTDGGKVYFGFGHAGGHKHGHRPEYSIPLLAVATKQVYLPYLFTSDSNPGINMKYTVNFEPLQRLSPGPVLNQGRSPHWSAILESFDYVLLGDARFFDSAVPVQLAPIYQGSGFTLYRNPAAAGKVAISRPGG